MNRSVAAGPRAPDEQRTRERGVVRHGARDETRRRNHPKRQIRKEKKNTGMEINILITGEPHNPNITTAADDKCVMSSHCRLNVSPLSSHHHLFFFSLAFERFLSHLCGLAVPAQKCHHHIDAV